MSLYIKHIFFLILFLKASALFAQNISFKQYITGFKKMSLPLQISRKGVEAVAKNEDYIKDSVSSKFIGTKFYPADEVHYVQHYYGCPVKNDSVTAVIYLKTVPVQGELWLVEIALYNSKTEMLLDKMLLSRYSISAEKESEFSNESPVIFSPSEIKKDLSIKTTTGLFQITLNGFKVLEGAKEKAPD